MNEANLTRRRFGLGFGALTGSALIAPFAAANSRISAAMLVERIKAQCALGGIVWSEPTVDTFKIGDPQAPVTGVVTTFMATLELMHKAVAAGANFIISHEPIFYNHFDRTDGFLDDPVYRAKTRFAADHGLIVWRFHDHYHRLVPEPMSFANAEQLGWQPAPGSQARGFSQLWIHPPTSLRALVDELGAHLPSYSTRVIGDPTLIVQRITNVGHTAAGVIEAWAQGEVAVACEVREWESVEYARDAIALGEKKALILIAHERGEERGMLRCAAWLEAFVPEVPVSFISSGEPFRILRS
jgi:putative NIF3 family GTP cyclohydrolase 1 type 2